MKIRLRKLDKSNWRQAAKLKVKKEQKGFNASNFFSLAQSKFESYYIPMGIFLDGKMVGFIMYGKEPKDKKYWMVRFMIDKKYQGKGYGRAAIVELVKLLKRKKDCKEILTTYVPGNEISKKLFFSLGFRETGKIVEEEERVIRLTWK